QGVARIVPGTRSVHFWRIACCVLRIPDRKHTEVWDEDRSWMLLLVGPVIAFLLVFICMLFVTQPDVIVRCWEKFKRSACLGVSLRTFRQKYFSGLILRGEINQGLHGFTRM